MMKTEIKIYSENEQREVEYKLKATGYSKVADCMWAKVYHKGNNEIIVSREY